MLVADAQGNTNDGFCLQFLYQGLKARIRNSRKKPGLGKLVHMAQAEIQRALLAIDAAGNIASNIAGVLSRLLAMEDSNRVLKIPLRVLDTSNLIFA